MNLLIVLCLLLTYTESLIVNDDVSSTEGRRDESEMNPHRSKPFSIKYVSLPTEKCTDIDVDSEKSENEVCRDYCKELKKGFFDGECLDEICHCKFDISLIVTSSEEKIRRKSKTVRGNGRQAVKCKNLIRVRGQNGSENHKGCGIHCRLLNSENKDGRCIDGICQCSNETIEEKRIIKEDEEEEKEEKKDNGRCQNNEECESECNGPNREPRCMSGICRCRILPFHQESIEIPSIDREIKKCEHRRKAVSNEICRSHCEDFSKDHREGRCVNGICQCGYAVFEMSEIKISEEDNKNSMETNKKARGRKKVKF